MSQHIPFHRRILGRALLYVMVPMVLVLAAVIVIAMRRTFDNLRQTSERDLQTQTALAAAHIEEANHNAVISAQRMAEAQMAGMFGDRQASLRYARMVLENSPDFTAAYIGYEPDGDGQDSAGLGVLPAEAMDSTGRFIPYHFIATDKGNRIELEPLVQMEGLYYQGVKDEFARTRTAAPMVTEPYIYQGKLIVEQTYPIVIDGEFKGVAGVDRALSDMESDLRRLSDELQADAYLISGRGKFIATTTDEDQEGATTLKTKTIAESPYRTLFGDLFEQTAAQTLVVEEDPVSAESCYYAASRIDTGRWLLIMRRPQSVILASVWSEVSRRIILAGGGILLILLLIAVSTIRLSRRVNVAVDVADRVARGDLTHDISTNGSQDETGVLIESINAMTGNLNGLIGQVKRSSIQLNSTATELAATSREQDAAVSSFGASANQIAAAVKQISATSTELAQTMEDVSEGATGTSELASAGQVGLLEMESSMKTLAEATGSIADKLGAINNKAANISGVVTTITKVADQTNLLSVNAAIEAEKAGEYGVGFLVVAREIRRLADQTAAATTDIEQMVAEMQSAVSAGVMEMDRFADRVRHSVADVGKIGQQMEQIIEGVRANTGRFERVVESVQSQSEGTEQINQAMGQLTGVASQSMEANQEFARAASELQDAITAMQSSIASFQLKS